MHAQIAGYIKVTESKYFLILHIIIEICKVHAGVEGTGGVDFDKVINTITFKTTFHLSAEPK
jgi:hypothetical protein